MYPRRTSVLLLAAWFLVTLGPGTWAASTATGVARWEGDIRAFEAEDQRNPPVPGGVVFYGSSSFRMWTNLATSFPAHRVVNRGFGGSQLGDLNQNFARVVPPHRPKLLLVYGGDNDIAGGKSAAQVEADFRSLVDLARRHCPETRVAFVAIKPSPSRLKYLSIQLEANTRVRRLASRYRRVDYIDTASPILGADGQPDARFFLADRLHLNGDGYRAWQAVIASYLDRWAR